MAGRKLFVCLPLVAAAYYVPISPLAEQRLHALGKQTVKQQRFDTAMTYYTTAAEHGHTSRSHLLLVLHLQRCGAGQTQTRDAFRQAVVNDRSNHQLLQAWALYESKHGNMHRAVHLLRRAAEMRPRPKLLRLVPACCVHSFTK